jgi:hypothetical protein
MRVGVAALLLLISCRNPVAERPAERPASAPDSGARPPEARIIDALPADTGDVRRRYQMAIEPCREPFRCRTLLRLVDGDRVLDTATLWDSASQEAGAEKVDPAWGGGDPLEGSPQGRAWATGDPDKSVYAATLMRTVRLPGGRLGLLATRRAGWDHVQHAHKLFVTSGGKLTEAWSTEDTGGPRWSSTQLVTRPDGSQDVLYVTARPSDNGPDALDATRVSWDEKAGRAVEAPAQGPALHYAVFGVFPRLAAARAEQAKLAECQALWVLPGKSVPGARAAFVLATVTAQPELSDQVTKGVQHCAPKTAIRMVGFPSTR